jgi:hypothetical protein
MGFFWGFQAMMLSMELGDEVLGSCVLQPHLAARYFCWMARYLYFASLGSQPAFTAYCLDMG